MGSDDMLSAVPIGVGLRHTPGTIALSISWPVAHDHGSLGQSDTWLNTAKSGLKSARSGSLTSEIINVKG